MHLAVATSKYWGAKGIKLGVAFMEETSVQVRNMILKYANIWKEHGNVEFFHTTTDPQIRLTLAGDGYWSYLGTDILSIKKTEPTMCLQGFTMNTPEAECMRVIPHEFGHSLGFPHEHMRKDIIELLDFEKTILYFRQTQRWSRNQVIQQVLTPLSEDSLISTPTADQISIMTYSLPGHITKNGKPILGGSGLSPEDITFVGQIYPKVGDPTKPPVTPPPPVGMEDIELKISWNKKTGKIHLPPGFKLDKF